MAKRDALLETAKRRAAVLELRLSGVTYRQIARKVREQFGPERLPRGWDERQAAQDVKRELERQRKENSEKANEIFEMELARLDRLLVSIWEKATDGNVAAIDRCLRIMERRARFLGLDAPDKHNIQADLPAEFVHLRTVVTEALSNYPEAAMAVAQALIDDDAETPPSHSS